MIPTIILLLILLLTRFNLRFLNKIKKMDQQECTICLGFAVDKVTIDCGHEFCNDCINPWLRDHRTCPLCRARIATDYESEEEDYEDVSQGQDVSGENRAQAMIDQDIAAHETFFRALELLRAHGPIERSNLESLATHLRRREEDESRQDLAGHWMVIANRGDIPPPLNSLHLMFPDGSRSHQFAMEVINGDALAFIQLQQNYAPRRLYLCPFCRRRVYNQVVDFIRHYSHCQYV